MTWIYAIDLIGTLVFAISGVLAGFNKRLDLVGSLILGFVTAIGGGTLRDMMIGSTPVGWMTNPIYIYIIVAAVPICYFFKERILKLRRSMFLFDTIGIGLFTILGIQKTLGIGLSVEVALLMGAVSASFGGVIRDVLSNEIPLIFRREIYATACFAGGIVFVVLEYFFEGNVFNMLASMLVVMVIRYLAVRFHWSLQIVRSS